MNKLLGLPPLASQHGADVDKLIIYLHWVMGLLFLGWIIYFAYVLIRFSRARNPKASYVGARTHVSTYIEGAVAVVEGILLIGFAVPLWAKAVDQFPSETEATVVRVVAQQFNWNIFYPGPDGEFGKQDVSLVTAENQWGFDESDPKHKDDIGPVLNDIRVPVNRPVIIYVTSKDVIHSLKIFPMRVTQDAIPGLRIPLWFTPTHVGTYQIDCAQLCGAGHAAMTLGRLIVQTQEDYDKWLSEQSKPGGTGVATEFE